MHMKSLTFVPCASDFPPKNVLPFKLWLDFSGDFPVGIMPRASWAKGCNDLLSSVSYAAVAAVSDEFREILKRSYG